MMKTGVKSLILIFLSKPFLRGCVVSRVSRVSSLQQNIWHTDPLLAVVAMVTMVLTTHWGPWSSARGWWPMVAAPGQVSSHWPAPAPVHLAAPHWSAPPPDHWYHCAAAALRTPRSHNRGIQTFYSLQGFSVFSFHTNTSELFENLPRYHPG